MKLILVVDDEPAIVDVLQTTLEDEGYRVVTAKNGLDALDRLAHEKPALVLCDVMMPVSDGRELVRTMRNSSEYARVPIVLMSAAGQLSRSIPNAADAFIAKPFDLNTVLDMVLRFAGPP